MTVFCFSLNAFALDSEMRFSKKELNQNALIATTGTDIATAIRVIELQLNASGCSRLSVGSPDMFEKPAEYRFNIESENCIAILKSSKCAAGYSPRNILANPRARDETVFGGEKYMLCLKGSSGAGASQQSGAK